MVGSERISCKGNLSSINVKYVPVGRQVEPAFFVLFLIPANACMHSVVLCHPNHNQLKTVHEIVL
jgi:hypothetical protein